MASDGGLNHSTDELTTHTSRKYGIYNTTLWGFSQGWNTDVQTGGRYHNGNTAYRQDFGTDCTCGSAGRRRRPSMSIPSTRMSSASATSAICASVSDSMTRRAVSATWRCIHESYDSRSSELVRDPLYADHLALGNGRGFHRSFDGGASFELLHDFGSGTVLEIEQGRGNRNLFYAVVRASGSCTLRRSLTGGNLVDRDGSALGMEQHGDCLNPADDDEVWAIRADDDDIKRSVDGGIV